MVNKCNITLRSLSQKKEGNHQDNLLIPPLLLKSIIFLLMCYSLMLNCAVTAGVCVSDTVKFNT
jgi:hypothetical protein